MKKPYLWLPLLSLAVLLTACKTTRIKGPEIKKPSAKPRLEQAKHSLKNKQADAAALPSVLGGLVTSDSWVIYKEKQQEEFKGHVSYDNGSYAFRSDYALSERKLNRFTARGKVYLKQTTSEGMTYEAHADYARYNYKTQQGELKAAKKEPLQLIYTDKTQPAITAYAQKATFNLADEIFVLEGDVRVERNAPEGKQTMTAQKVTAKQAESYILLEGDAVLSDGLRTLEAETIVYDGKNNTSSAYGDRPLVHGQTEQGTFAIIADNVQSDAEGNQIILDGKVQGWVVSPQLNNSDINTKF